MYYLPQYLTIYNDWSTYVHNVPVSGYNYQIHIETGWRKDFPEHYAAFRFTIRKNHDYIGTIPINIVKFEVFEYPKD